MTDAILEALPDGVIVIAAERTIAYMNPAAERISGWRLAEALGRPYGTVLPLRDAGGLLVHEHHDPFSGMLAIVSGTPEREYLVTRRDGSEVWVAARASFKRDAAGLIEQAVVSVRDIGRRRRLEQVRADLISTVSHEIRSPLTSIKGFTSTLLHRWDRFSDEQKQVMLQTMNADADRVTRLLGDLLDVSRLEAGRLELKRQEVDLITIATEVILRLRLEADRHTLEVKFPQDFPKVLADPGKIEQVLINLVENAIKYTATGAVRVTGENRPEDVVVLVSDQGEGIPARHLPHIFTKFYRRGHGERRSGTGLGLYICSGIVEAHGGRIWVERSDSSGTVFAFTLPKGEE